MTVAARPDTMDDRPEPSTPEPPPGTIFTPYRRTQAIVALASVLCIALFWEGATWVSVPPVPRFDGSLLAQSRWPLAILATYVMLLSATAIGTVVAGWSWFFSGLFAGSVGLITLSVRCGSMHYVLFDAASHGDATGIFLRLLGEQCLLFFAIALIWTFFWRRFQALTANRQSRSDGNSALLSTAAAVVTQIALMGALVLLLAATDVKKQAVVSVFLAGLLGTMLGEYLFPNRKAGGWYWLGPFIVGVVGYAAAYFNAAPWTIGFAAGPLANLAHPLPLDYAGAGIAGALLGYWMGGEHPHVAFFSRRDVAPVKPSDSTPRGKPQ